jgi:transcriptional regulator with XRE-family HTH domain
MFRSCFIQLKKQLDITGRALSQSTGIPHSRISEYINNRRDISTETLWILLQGLEDLSPGAISAYCSLLLTSQGVKSQDLAQQIMVLVAAVKKLQDKLDS